MTNDISRNAPCPCGSGRKYKNCCLPEDRAANLEQLRRASPVHEAAEHTWEAGIFPLPTAIGDQPGRRVSLVLVAAAGLVLYHDLLTDPLGRIDEVADALQSALERAEEQMGVPLRKVSVRHRDVSRALGIRMASCGVEVSHSPRLPGLEDAARSLCGHMLGLDTVPLTASAPTWRGWGLSGSQCRALFAAAARFRRAEPWKQVDDEPISVFGRHGSWTATVMGLAGQAFGLSVYTDPRDYEDLLTDTADLGELVQGMKGAMIAVAFEPRSELTREMQREVASAGWEVADPEGYPVAFTTNTPAGGLDPAVVDVLAAMLLAIPDFLEACEDEIEEGLAGQRIVWEHPVTGLRLSYTVPGGYEWPIPERLGPGGPRGNRAEPGARLTGLKLEDAFPDAPVADRFGAHLRESVTAATAARHAGTASALVRFLNGRHGVPLCALHEYDLRMFLYDDFPRSMPGFSRIEALPGSLRKFFMFLAERHGLEFPWAEALLRDKESLHHRVRMAPVGSWWDEDVREFRADVWIDLDGRGMLLPDDWAGALEPEAFTGIDEARLHHEAQRRWLTWRDDLIQDGLDTPDELTDALGARLLGWLDEPDPEDPDGLTRLAVIRAERNAAPDGLHGEMERVFLGLEEAQPARHPVSNRHGSG
jgi:Domain of unknown function (DUF6930)/SEC-C motif